MNTDKGQFGKARHSVRAVCEMSCDGARGATRPASDELWRGESQRDSIIQPRVARNELPWVCDALKYNPEGVESPRVRSRCNPVGVENDFGRLPRVVRCAANPGLNDSIPWGLAQSVRVRNFATDCLRRVPVELFAGGPGKSRAHEHRLPRRHRRIALGGELILELSIPETDPIEKKLARTTTHRKLNAMKPAVRNAAGLLLFGILLILFELTPLARAACDLKIISAGPCLNDGSAGIPHVGDTYSLHVTFNINGTPSNTFRLKFTLANATWYSGDINGQNGWTYGWQYSQSLPLDDAIPWSVTLDPDGVSGDTNLANNSTNGVFTPVPPSGTVELYSPRMLHGSVINVANFQSGSGNIPNVYVIFGQPSTHGAQCLIAASGPPNGQSVVTPPYGIPVFQIARTNVSSGTFQDTNPFTVQLNNIRVNPTLLRTATWAR